MSILAVYREPFGFQPHVQRLPEGETLDQMRRRMRGLPEGFAEHGVICLNGHPAPRALWGVMTPKAPAVTEVTFHCPPRGGGGDSGKMIVSMVAAIALTIVSGGIASGAILGGLTGATAAGGATLLSTALGAGVALAGSLLISALVPPPTVPMAQQAPDQKTGRDPGAASAQGNLLEPNGAIPRVIGERKVFPPLAAEPLTYFDGPDEVVQAAYVLAGPHRLRNVRVGAADITSMRDVDHAVHEGWPGGSKPRIATRQSRTDMLQAELRGHVVESEDGVTIETVTGDFATSLPQPQVVSTRDRPDEHQLQIVFPNGLHYKGDDGITMLVPFRLRLREPGGEWVNLPELHFRAANLSQMRATIRLLWRDDAAVSPGASGGEGWYEARIASPDQTVAPAGGGWEADPYFVGDGADYLTRANIDTTGVRRVAMDRYTATVVLDRALFPARRYEVEIMRGMAVRAGQYNSANYQVSGSVWALFGYRGTPPRIQHTKNMLVDPVYLVRSVSIWNEPVLGQHDVALIEVQARNRQLDQVSVVAGGYVRDWDGTGWNEWTVTDNPAPHLRDILVGSENLDPVPLPLIDDDEIVAWRQHCIDQGYTCNALIQDLTLDDAARIVAACGYARPRMSDTWGVVTDYDRSAEQPTQIFTPRNMADFSWTKGFANVPDGFRVNYRAADRDYDIEQISVFRHGHSDDSGRMEQVTYEGLVTEADAIRRALYDQAQAEHRSTFYSWTAAAESITCRRGDLVGVQHDMLSKWSGAGIITQVIRDGDGLITVLSLDEEVPRGLTYDMLASEDLLAEPDLLALGLEMGAAIRARDGTVTVQRISGGAGQGLVFRPPLDLPKVEPGGLVAFGPVGRETLRLVISGITPKPDFTATITAVDEAPEIWEMMNGIAA